jgi:hypothetical protein
MVRALYDLGYAYWLRGDAAAQPLLEESLALAHGVGDPQAELMTAALLAGIVVGGDPVRAQALAERSLSLAQAIDSTHGRAWAHYRLGEVAVLQGDAAQAAALVDASVAGFRDLDDRHCLPWALNQQAEVALQAGEAARATALWQESLAVSAQTGHRIVAARALAGLASAASRPLPGGLPRGALAHAPADGRQTTMQRAARLWGAVAAVCDAMGVPPTASAVQQRGLAQARRTSDAGSFSAAWGEGRAMTLEQAITYALAEDPTAD